MIDVQVSSTVRTPIDVRLLKQAALAVLDSHFENAEISICAVGDTRMRRLNRESLGHDYVTDVLSFDHGQIPGGRLFELIVCASFAGRQSAKHGVPKGQELARYVVHGALHCVGYDDHSSINREQMWREQEQVMKKLFGQSYAPTGL